MVALKARRQQRCCRAAAVNIETAVLSYDRHDHEHAGLAHEGGEGPGGDRRACGWGCSVPNVGLLVIHYHLRGWWCRSTFVRCCCCSPSASASGMRCFSLRSLVRSRRARPATDGCPLHLRGASCRSGRSWLASCTTSGLARQLGRSCTTAVALGLRFHMSLGWLHGTAVWLAIQYRSPAGHTVL